MSEIWTIMWKEWKDLFFSGGRITSIRLLLFIAMLGLFFPLSYGMQWFNLQIGSLVLIIYIPFLYVVGFIGDAIAGERERHTLETLLASRISDRAILLGKVIITVVYMWAIVLISLVLGWVALNLFNGQAHWAFYAPIGLWLEVIVLSLLAILLAASGGVLVSLRTSTVRQAQQILLLCTTALGGLIFLVVKLIPAGVIASLSPAQFLSILMLVLVILDAILLIASLASFRRSRLILS